ncbi:BN860_16160g1_1 [Zygosaccharomyces bailii CLIB 213]|uniref:BN860_16160g1_1 n=1 Tax=Zygosaccharomyces bailii (strain CLIB 213 / ATCC 58445 / CBS 680 / BCRC 21525 / NBRC 1098 / NCYC 1416 / NRRL Y-2227) TaxID=1333698 RepID=A0A8J2T5Z8_ZYGB2|nr:BN860_16160g1_1 [Zygosaccharomyces bailii CLIB 213]
MYPIYGIRINLTTIIVRHCWMIAKGGSIYHYVACKRDKWLLLVIVSSTILSGIVPAVVSILTGRVFNLLNDLNRRSHPMQELTVASMSILVVGAGSLGIIWLCITSWMLLGETQHFEARNKLLSSYLIKPMEWYDKNDSIEGELTQLNRCVEELRSSSAEASALTWKNVVTIVALLATSFYYSWSLTLITMCSAPVIIICAALFSHMINIHAERENESTSKSSQLLTWSLEAAQLVKLNCTEKLEISSFQISVKKCSINFIKLSLYASINTAILKFLTLTMFIQAFWFGCTMIRKGELIIADVITCFQSCIMLGATINGTLQQIVVLQKGQVGVRQTRAFLALDEKFDELKNQSYSSPPHFTEKVEFCGVQFSYPSRPSMPALKNVSIEFPVGKTTFVIGKSGSGKSSLANLLLKFYQNYKGDIFIDGTNIKVINQSTIIENIMVVEQRCHLFNDSLRNNILFGCRDIDEVAMSEKLKAACRIALLENFIHDLPYGLDTAIGSEGIMPSGGQQQRIAIARAFMRDSSILILDEAVSALDVVHRGLLMSAIRTWRADKTTIILTHDLSEIQPNDMVYLVEDGEVLEKGLQKELLSNHEGRFFNLANIGLSDDFDDVYSQITTVETQKAKIPLPSYEDSLIEYEVETPRMDEECGSLFEVSSIPLEDLSFRQKKRCKTLRVTVQEEFTEQDSVEHIKVESANNEELVSMLEIMKHMYTNGGRKYILYVGIICSLYAGVANPIFSYTFSYLLNGIVPDGETHGGSAGYLLKWSMIVMGIAAADAVLNFVKDFVLGYYSETYIRMLRNSAMRKITFNRLAWSSKIKPSELSALIMNDLRDLRTLTSKFVNAVSSFLIVSSVGLIWALITGWKLSLVCVSMFPLMIIFSVIYGNLLKKYETEYKNTIAKLENHQYEIVKGIKTIRNLQIESHFMGKFKELERQAKGIGRRRAIVIGFGVAGSNTLTMVVQGILYYYAIKLVITKEYTSKRMFETFTLLLFTIMTCNNLVNQIPDIRKGQRAAHKIYRILAQDESCEHAGSYPCRKTPILSNHHGPLISFKDLSFEYPSTPTVKILKHLNLDIYGGDRIAIVGESGCGKSTLINLITGLYESPKNSLFIDHTDLHDWALFDLRQQIAVVEQKPVIFSGTIRENLIYGVSSNIQDIDLFDMLKYVGIYDFISTLPDGLETKIDSALLSGGQNQRLCIARGLLKKPKILILDECTSALDAVSSNIINEIVRVGPPAIVTISITHDEQMVKACNKVAVLKNGCVVEIGDPEELLNTRSNLSKVLTRIEG